MTAPSLRVDTVDVHVRTVDWSEIPHLSMAGRDHLSWEAYEAQECSKCRQVVVLPIGSGGAAHSEVDPDAALPACTLGSHHGGTGPCVDCVDSTGDGGVGVCMCEDAPCDGGIDEFSGPAMNYFYPCPFKDTNAAAVAIRHLPLCVVEFSDGETGFALTGGGMDLTWEICAAYVASGYLPPASFRLPRMGGLSLGGRNRQVYEAMRTSHEVRINWSQNDLRDLDELKLWVEERSKPTDKQVSDVT